MSKKMLLENLKRDLGSQLITSEQVSPPPGIPTGWSKLDQYLLWHGFPKGALSLLVSESGGATTLWSQCASLVTQRQQWVAWLDSRERQLSPWSLRHRQVNLSKFLYVSPPQDHNQRLWALQEIMSLCLFEMVGCDLDEQPFKPAQLLKLKKLALRYQTALVLFSNQKQVTISSHFALILQFTKHHAIVHRAQHRLTPYSFERRDLYADTLPQLAAGRRALCG